MTAGAAASLLFLYVWVYRINGAELDHLASAIAFSLWNHHEPLGHYLFQQHNEHRILVPRLVILGLGLLTKWNNEPEMFAHAALMCITAIVLFGAFCLEAGAARSRGDALFAFTPAILMALSPRSYEALTGFGFPHYLEILFYVWALRLLVFRRGWRAWTGALFWGEAATFSLANGLWIWPMGLLVILSRLRSEETRSGTLARAAAWGVASALTFVAYFDNYLPTTHPQPSFFVEHPLTALEHFFVLNGTVFAASIPAAAAFGTIAVALYLWVCAVVIRDWLATGERPPYGFWLIASVLGWTATITAGRAMWGPIQALDSRYAASVMLGPVGMYWCLVVRKHAWRFAPALTRVAAATMIAGYAIVTVQTWAVAPEWYSSKKERIYLLETMPNQPDSLVVKTAAVVSDGRWLGGQIAELGINVFAEPHVNPADLTPAPVRPLLRIDTVNGRPRGQDHSIVVGPADPVEVRGYAFNAAGDGPARALFLTIDGKTDFAAVTGLFRPGTTREARWTGFVGSFAGALLTVGPHALALKVVADDGRHAYVTDPIATIVRQ